MALGRPRAGRARYVHVKLSGETHEWWVEAKHCFQMNSDDALANHLLELATRLPFQCLPFQCLPFQCRSYFHWYCHLVRRHCL